MDPKKLSRIKEPTLLEKRIQDLSLQVEGTKIEGWIRQFYEELQQKNLIFRPACFLADEWFTPKGISAIGIPFYLAHSRLKRLEQKIMYEAEGSSKTEFMKLMRHEAGHVFQFAFNLHKKKKWIKLFGSSSEEYPDDESYRFRPYSRAYVRHIDKCYAQSHPDEDFAETFAVWLAPSNNWRKRYKGWKALKKLEFVDQLMKSIVGKQPVLLPKFNPKEHAGLRIKLKTYYQRKRKRYEEDFPEFYDNDLKMLFTEGPQHGKSIKAPKYLKSSRRRILDVVGFWTKEKKYTINELLDRLIVRCDSLKLFVRDEKNVDFQISGFITSLVMNYTYTGKFRHPK